MDLQTQVEIGRQAEGFLEYVSREPYFVELIERVKLEYAGRILALHPKDSTEFTVLRERMDVWDEIMSAVRGDITMASEAMKLIDGTEEKKGLL